MKSIGFFAARNRRRAAVFGLSGFLIVAVSLVLAACGGPPRGASREADTSATGEQLADARWQRSGRAIEAIEVTAGTFVSRVDGAGRIAGVREATVVSQVQGVLLDVAFDLGDTVEQGQRLASFDDRSERLSMEQAQAQARSAAFELEAVRRRVEAGTASAVEAARIEAAASGADAAYQRARSAWQDRTVTAPIAGRIARKDSRITEGNFVPSGIAVAHIVDTTSLQIEIAVGEREVGFVTPGARAQITIEVCADTPQIGLVRSVAAGSDPSTGSFPVIVEWENRCGDLVRSGMSASVSIEPAAARQVLLVPTSALSRRQGETVVFVVQDDRVAARVISVGRRVGNRAEVLEGLSAGELVAVSALPTLSDGDPVSATVIAESGDLR